MKLLTRDEFMRLPAGIIYVKLEINSSPDRLCVKGETLPAESEGAMGDFWLHHLNSFEASCPSVWDMRLELMGEFGDSYPLDTIMERDGMFEASDRFLVYEIADLKLLRQIVGAAIAAEEGCIHGV